MQLVTQTVLIFTFVCLKKYNYLRNPRYELLYNEVSKYQDYQNHKHLIRTNATSPINQFLRCK